MKIILVDDHPSVRAGVQSILRELAPQAEIFEGGTLADAQALLVAHGAQVDLLIMDLGLPDADRGQAAKHVRAHHPMVPLVVLSATDDRGVMRDVLSIGAMGFIPKTSSVETMRAALTMILAGQIYVPPDILDLALKSPPINAAEKLLSAREKDVLRFMAEGKSNRDIGQVLGISENTVRAHVSAILRAIGANNRTEAAAAARRLGLVPPS